MARELGGGRLAQVIAALAIALSPLPLFQGTEFQYTTFDYLWWVLTAYFVTHLLKTSNPRWWMAIGAAMGLGLPTKYAIVFFIAGILGGAWFGGGMALAILIFLPNLVWQVRHGFVSLHFLQAHTHPRCRRGAREWISARSVPGLRESVCCAVVDCRFAVLFARLALSSAGVDVPDPPGAFSGREGPRLLPGSGLSYAHRHGRNRRWALESVFFIAIAASGIFCCALILPLASGGRFKDFALQYNGDLREEIGRRGYSRLNAPAAAEQRRCVGPKLR
jgi:4-amino-4-deoxy-L-arabinose transferase-like glycosyltransferase